MLTSEPRVPADWDDTGVGRKPRRSQTQQTTPVLVGTVNATRTYHGPVIPYAGRVWDSVLLTVTASSSPVMTLQPQIVGADGVPYDVGTPILMTGRVLVAGVPIRCHDEVRLSKRIPAGSTLLLKVTFTSGSLTNAQFHFVTTGG